MQFAAWSAGTLEPTAKLRLYNVSPGRTIYVTHPAGDAQRTGGFVGAAREAVGTVVSVAETITGVLGLSGMFNVIPGKRMGSDTNKQFPSLSSASSIPYIFAKAARVSPTWTSYVTHPGSGGQAEVGVAMISVENAVSAFPV